MNSDQPVEADAPRPAPRKRPGLQRVGASARRVEDAATDLFLDPRHRLSDRVRAFAGAMLDDLVDGIEQQIRVRLQPHLASLGDVGAASAARMLLADAGLLRDVELVGAILRRAESFILADRLSPPREAAGLPVDDADPDIANAATELLVAEARRLDRFGAPVLLFDDLPAEVAHRLVWRVAAAVRRHLCALDAAAEPIVDAAMPRCALEILASHDEGRGLDAIATRLAGLLRASRRVDGRLLNQLLQSGQVAAFTAALAAATGLPGDEAWRIVADPADGRLALALRAAGASRDPAAMMLATLLPPGVDAVAEIDLFDACDAAEAADAIAPLAREPVYRAAIRALGEAYGDAE